MLHAKINYTDLTASKLVLGTDTFGTLVDETECFRMLDRFTEADGNMIDTASIYADWLGMGKSISEKTIGKWLTTRGCRNKMIISTKGGHHDLNTLTSRLALASVREDFQASLANLQTDYIDIYWLHKDDVKQTPESLIEMLNEAAPVEYARYLGVSNWSYDRIKAANDHAKANGLRPVIASQIQHSIAKLNQAAYGIVAMDADSYQQYQNNDLNVFAFSSQAKGFFAIMENSGLDGLPSRTRDMFLNDENLALFDRLKAMSAQKGISIPMLVIAALVSDSAVNTFAQIGPRTLSELEISLQGADVQLTEQERILLLNS